MKTQDIKIRLIGEIEGLRGLTARELDYRISDIVDQLLSSSVQVRSKVFEPRNSPVPDYNSKTDGDYSSFLALNNVD